MSDLEDELREVFGAEAVELIGKLSRALVSIERAQKGEKRTELIGEIFRIAHTLKGAAATAGRQDFVDVSHALESCMERVREGRIEPTSELIGVALSTGDLLGRGAREPIPKDAADAMIRTLEALTAKAAPESAAPAAASAPAPAPKRSAPRAKKDRAALLDALARQIAELGEQPTQKTLPAMRDTILALVSALPKDSAAGLVVRDLLAATATDDAAVRPKLVEASFLALDFLHASARGEGSDEEATEVRRLLGSVRAKPEPRAQPQATSAPAQAPEATLRVQVSVLDSLHYRIEELVGVKLRLDFERTQIEAAQAGLEAMRRALPGHGTAETRELSKSLEVIHSGLAQEVHRLDLLAGGLQEDIKEVRMVPVGLALEPLYRTVRDLAQGLGKEASLSVDGEAVRVDKRLLELIRDPLTQLVRNAVAHGLEKPQARLAAKKPAAGTVRITVESRESQVFIDVADDGGGIDPEGIREEAVRREIIDAKDAAGLSRRETLNLIFAPGFSTSREVTQVAGRGVGLDVVRENVGRLGGRIEFFTETGKGTRFVLVLPLTLAASRGLTVVAGRHTYCLPLNPVEEVLKITPTALGRAQGRLALAWRHQAITFARLDELLEGGASTEPSDEIHVVVLALSDRRLALGVDQLLGQQEMVVKAPAPGTPPLKFVMGTTTLADGRLVTVLDPSALVEAVGTIHLEARTAEAPATVLVVDDSLTSRTMVASVLEGRRYRVVQAHDGDSALQLLQREQIDLVVSDVEMPGVDGFELTRRIRSSSSNKELPVVLLTSVETAEARARGANAGANAYMVKGRFESGGFLSLVADLVAHRER